MEEDGGANAPVTRLRRRLSVEQDDSRSPTPSTPTKKRGRLAAKPQLDLIEENAIIESPKRTTRKSVSREIDLEEKLTPARKSTRIRYNSSLVETKENEPEDNAEEIQTPGRKITRSRSNTSLLEVPSVDVNTPRAKRAARRSSVLESDTESVTPIRTRRTRKGSTSSDIQATQLNGSSSSANSNDTKVAKTRRGRTAISTADLYVSIERLTAEVERITRIANCRGIMKNSYMPDNNVPSKDVPVVIIEAISEEQVTDGKSNSNTNDDTSNEANSQTLSPSMQNSQNSPSNVRKSPRLMLRKSRDRKSTGKQDKTIENGIQEEEKVNNPDKSSTADTTNTLLDTDQTDGETVQIETKPSDTKDELSLSSANLIINIEDKPKTTSGRNKSLSAVDVKDNEKRHRTKSCTTLSADLARDDYFHSDNEKTKKKLRQKQTSLIENADKTMTDYEEIKTNNIKVFELTTESNNSKRKKRKSTGDISIEHTVQESIAIDRVDKEKSLLQSTKDVDISIESNKENLDEINAPSAVKRLFESHPTVSIQSFEFIEDSDTGSVGKEVKLDDQCVPVAYQSHDNPFAIRSNQDDRIIEPMDIDETMPDNVSLTEFNANRSRNSSLSVPQNSESKVNASLDKSKRKSSISNTSAKYSEQSRIENKSTLVLSDLNVSAGSEASASESLTVLSNKSKRKSSISKALDKSTNVPVPDADSVTSTQEKEQFPEKPLNKVALLTCLTSTPVQDKDSKKSNLQVNTSVITPINENKKDLNKSNNITMAEISEDDSDEDSDDDSSSERIKMVDDEAMDAGDDYQSGDSQDEEERQYANDHEIIEKGETLTSDEEDLSSDSEYEKDSFLVSSDDEDNELLSGSDEDLDMSDNELTMSKKSKKKYDDRKAKEQKKASREMFEARHGPKPDKVSMTEEIKDDNSRVLDSTLLDSGDDNKVPPKKNKRMRLESDSSFAKSELEKSDTKNDSTLADMDEIGYKKKKSKRLSESLCNESVLNENEVTVNGVNLDEQGIDDPLTVAVKQEPKTPQKLDISTIHFTDRAEVEQVEVADNVTILKINETSDPLQAALDENDSDDESISENEEATNNFDSILNNLNNHHKKQIKSRDTSLNLKETKRTSKEPIIEQLNITTTKQELITNSFENKDGKSATSNNKVIEIEESSSDSMDMKLLFSDESNDGHKSNDDKVEKTATIPEKIIPLKRCDGKTDLLRQSLSTGEAVECNTLNTSKNKKNKRKGLQSDAELITTFTGAKDVNDSNECPFFIDTVGTYADVTDDTTASLHSSSKKNKQKHKKYEGSDEDGPPTEISSKKNNITDISLLYDEMASNTKATKKNKNKEPKKDKASQENSSPININSKKDKITDISLSYDDDDDITEVPLHTKASKKNKDKQHKTDVASQEDGPPTNISSKKDKITEISLLYDEVMEVPLNTKVSKKNKDRKQNASLRVENDTSLHVSPKKNKSLPVGDVIADDVQINISKKDKNKKNNQSFIEEDTVDSKLTTSSKKSKNKKGETSFARETIVESTNIDVKKNKKDSTAIANENSLDNTSSKKKNKNTDLCLINNDSVVDSLKISKNIKNQSQESQDKRSIFDIVDEMEETKFNRKRKRNISSLTTEEPDMPNVAIEVLPESKQKKSKIEDLKDKADTVSEEELTELNGKKKRKRGRRNIKRDINQSPVTPTKIPTKPELMIRGTQEIPRDQNRKRKVRDGDDGGKLSKVMKTNSLGKVRIPRLPETILNQLEDKPRKEHLSSKKAKVAAVATTEFIVDEVQIRKNKPSNYLEESIYLNNYESPVSKKPAPKLMKNKPKTLPFIPVASTSDKGFTTSFQVRVLSGKMEFKATAEKEADFKTTYLRDRKAKTNNLIFNKHKKVNLSKY